MSKFKLVMITLLLGILLFACNSDDDNETVPEENDAVTEEENNENTEEDEDAEDTSETTDSDTDDANKESSEASEGEVLSLGETGTIETNYGDFEITFESFQVLDELEGETPSSGVFVLVDANIENTGDEAIMGSDFYTAALFDDRELRAENLFHPFKSINLIEDTLEPGDSTEAQFIFNTSDSESFELIYNYGFESVATVVTWEFTADEASN